MRLNRASYESGYIAAMMDVWRGFYASNEPALRLFIDKAWKATGAENAHETTHGSADDQ